MKFFGTTLLLLGLVQMSSAQEFEATSADLAWRENFRAKQNEAAVGGVAYFSPSVGQNGRPTINYAGALAQFGHMFTGISADGTWSGSLEGLLEGYGTTIFKGRGSYMAGTTFLLRYNFVPPHWKVVPYFQAGAGTTVTDVDRDVLGQNFNFNLNVGTGLRFFVQQNCSLNLEYRYQHVSNAGMSSKNLGVDAQGVALSVAWYF